jgi:hypothetical protein
MGADKPKTENAQFYSDFGFSISLPNNEQVFDDKSGGEGWQNDAFRQL